MSPTRRFALLILIIILAGAGAAPAQAGEYTVQSCNAALGYRGTGWAAASSHPHLAVYDNCLPGAGTPAWNAGLVTRNGVASDPKATVPQGAYSAWTFRAPTGAKLSRIGYHHEFCGWSGFKAGIASASGTWLHASGPAACGTMAAPDFTLALGGATSVQLRTQCVAGPCKVGDGLNAYGTINNVAVTISDTTKPSLAITGGSATTPGWKRGLVTVAYSATDNVGIARVSISAGRVARRSSDNVQHDAARPLSEPSNRVSRSTRASSRAVLSHCFSRRPTPLATRSHVLSRSALTTSRQARRRVSTWAAAPLGGRATRLLSAGETRRKMAGADCRGCLRRLPCDRCAERLDTVHIR